MKQVQIIGNLGGDAKQSNGNGRSSLYFTVGVNETWKDAQGNKQERTDWFKVFTGQTNLLNYLTKGTKVFVQGALRADVYRSEKTGQFGVDLNINADKIQLLGSATAQESRPQGPQDQPVETTALPWEK